MLSPTLPTSGATGRTPDTCLVDPDALNKELASRLRECTLICELDLDEAMHARLVGAMRALERRGIADDAWALRWHRALTATYLVAEGVFNSSGRSFWPNLSVEGFTRDALSQVFVDALEVYRLERFASLVDAGARRFVAPIHAHGGIPKYSLRDFFGAVVSAMRVGAADARDMIAYWREHGSRLQQADAAVQRFLLHGGDVSLDFLDRCIDLVRARPQTRDEATGERFGLPAYVCQAFVDLAPELGRLRDGSASGAVVPRPCVVIDPWDASGPMLVLPGLPGAQDASWQLVAQGGSGRFGAVAADRIVPLAPAPHWGVELRRHDGELARSFTFAGLARAGAMLFDYDDGQLIADPTRLRRPRVWILRPSGDDGAVRRPDGKPLEPFEEAPNPAGAWDGYVLSAYDLSGVERLAVGRAVEGGAFWVRVRGERIALDGTPVPAVHTEDGLPVHPRVPTLHLPGFIPGVGTGSWRVKVVCDGVEHVFDAARLSTCGPSILGMAIPDARIARVQVTARGPLGMDLRTEFCVVPGLQVDRPSAALLPGRTPDHVVAHVEVRGPDGRPERVSVRSGTDLVTTTVRDRQGGIVNLRITVPCLLWAVVTDAGERGDLGQLRARIASRSILDATVSLLVIRTRQPGIPVTLQLRRGGEVLQQVTATPAGDDGRWAFDLRQFADTIRASGEPTLTFMLVLRGAEVPVADVRAELDVTDLRVHQHVVPGHASVTLTWREPRPLRHRVARLWPLTTPWRAPIERAVPDGARGEITLSGSDDEITPGCYLAEVAVDDGWSGAPQRPHCGAKTARQMRLGVLEDERRWVRRLPEDDPFTALAAATLGGAESTLSPADIERITPAALDTIVVARDLRGGHEAELVVDEIARLICGAPVAFARGATEAAVDWSARHDTPFLTTALDLLPRLGRSAPGALVDDLGGLWELCPPLAALLDLPHRAVPHVAARVEAGLGLALGAVRQCELVPPTAGRTPDLQRFVLMPVELLVGLQRACALVPKRPLDRETQAAVHFEWLLADKRGAFGAAAWCAEHLRLLERSADLRPDLARAAREIRTPQHLAQAFPSMVLPELVHIAAIHVVTGSSAASRGVAALRPLVGTCPGIVTRSLVLAAALAHAPN